MPAQPPPPEPPVAKTDTTPDGKTAVAPSTGEPADLRAARRATYERWSRYPILILSLGFIVGFVLQFSVSDHHGEREIGQILLGIAWVGFIADYAVSLLLAADRRRFVVTHVPLLVAILLPPMRFLLIIRAINGVAYQHRNRFGGRIRIYLLYVTTVVIVAGALLELAFERKSDASNIRSLGDSLWWVMETISTVGYGDYYPVTVGGRLVAVTLFINGIALLSVVTATLAGRVLGDAGNKGEEATVTLNDLQQRLLSMERAIDALTANSRRAATELGQPTPSEATSTTDVKK